MKIIGITGGVGSGKSRVLSYMESHFDAVICQADHVAWELQKPGERCYIEIVKYFGNEILNDDATIQRGKLGQIVFSDKNKLEVLNNIMHPAVKESVIGLIQQEKEKELLISCWRPLFCLKNIMIKFAMSCGIFIATAM